MFLHIIMNEITFWVLAPYVTVTLQKEKLFHIKF